MIDQFNDIPVEDYFSDIARTIIENEDEIYLNSVKHALATKRKSNYLNLIDNIAEGLAQENYFKSFTYNELQLFIIECSKKSQIDDNDHIYSKQGMGWFIGNFVDITIKSKCFSVEFDKLFKDTFKLHFSLNHNNIPSIVSASSNDFYFFCDKYSNNREKKDNQSLLICYYVVSLLIDEYDYEDRDSLVNINKVKSILSEKYNLEATERDFLVSIETLNKIINSNAIEAKYLQSNIYVPIKELHFYTTLRADYLKNGILEGIRNELNKNNMLK